MPLCREKAYKSLGNIKIMKNLRKVQSKLVSICLYGCQWFLMPQTPIV